MGAGCGVTVDTKGLKFKPLSQPSTLQSNKGRSKETPRKLRVAPWGVERSRLGVYAIGGDSLEFYFTGDGEYCTEYILCTVIHI